MPAAIKKITKVKTGVKTGVKKKVGLAKPKLKLKRKIVEVSAPPVLPTPIPPPPPPPPPPIKFKASLSVVKDKQYQEYYGNQLYNIPSEELAALGKAGSMILRFRDIGAWLVGLPNNFPVCCGACILTVIGMRERIKLAAHVLVDNAPSLEDAEEFIINQMRILLTTDDDTAPNFTNTAFTYRKYAMIFATSTPGEGQVSYIQAEDEVILKKLGFTNIASGKSKVHSTVNPGVINAWVIARQ